MVAMQNNYSVITLNVCTLPHLPHQLSLLRHLLGMVVCSGSHLGPLKPSQRGILIN